MTQSQRECDGAHEPNGTNYINQTKWSTTEPCTYFIGHTLCLFTWVGKENDGNLNAFHKALFNVGLSQWFMSPYMMRNMRRTILMLGDAIRLFQQINQYKINILVYKPSNFIDDYANTDDRYSSDIKLI